MAEDTIWESIDPLIRSMQIRAFTLGLVIGSGAVGIPTMAYCLIRLVGG